MFSRFSLCPTHLPMTATEKTVTYQWKLRPVETTDEPLLYAIYASTRADEMALVTNWDEQQKELFLRQQFQAQYQYYEQIYKNKEFSIILCNGEAAGRLYLDYRPHDIRIVDIALLPAFRNTGIGGSILQTILNKGTQQAKSVSIHVERYNRALHLYQRLGFRVISEENPVYYLMEWKP